MRVDLHTHTWYSPDGVMSPRTLTLLSKKKGIDVIAITDHNRLTRVKDLPIPVIWGEEVYTEKGEILALFIEEEIPPSLSPEETIDRIREQGGIYIIPHPFDRFRKKSALLLHDFIPPKDAIIEVLNARYVETSFYEEALSYARGKFPITASSDAHTPIEVGRAWTEVPPFDDLEELKRLLIKGKGIPKGSFSPRWVHVTVPFIRFLHSVGVLPLERDV